MTIEPLEKLVNFELDRKADDTTMKSRMASRTTFHSTTFASDKSEVSFLEKSRFEMDDFCNQIEMLSETWDKEISTQGLNLYLASQKFSLEIANKDNVPK